MPKDNNTQPQPVELPEDLTARDEQGAYAVTDDQLAELHEQAQTRFDQLYEGDTPDVSGLNEAAQLVETIEQLRAERSRRDEERDQRADQLAQLHARVHGDDTGEPNPQDPGEPAQPQPQPPPNPPQPPPAPPPQPTQPAPADPAPPPPGGQAPAGQTAAAVEGEIVDPQGQPLTAARGTIPVDRQRLGRGARSLNQHLRDMAARGPGRGGGGSFDPGIGRNPVVSLQQAAQFAPDVRMPTGGGNEVHLLTTSDIPDHGVGAPLTTVRDVAKAMAARARSVPLGPTAGGSGVRYPVAYVDRQHRFRLDDRADLAQINEVIKAATDPAVLTAAGGWCAPPTTRYDFYNVVCEDGLIDVATVGVPRGSMQWPISTSFGDIMGLDDNPWTWTEQDDVDATTNPQVRKPCQRIPCPRMAEATLDCDGICLTVGNLMDFAWPELVEHQTRLLMAAFTHYMNMRQIQAMVAGSTEVKIPSIGAGVVAPLLSALNLQAWDIREYLRMCNDAIMESILPRWIVGMVQDDIALRQGLTPDEAFGVALVALANWLDARNIRAQLVTDWQIGGPGQLGGPTPARAWPSMIRAMVYPPGTWLRGQGLRLSLGVIRDSVLNAENDHTAAWMEECHLMAKVGVVSRVVDIPVCPNGMTNSGAPIECPEIES